MRRTKLLSAIGLTAILTPTLLAQDKIDNDALWKIRREALEHSQILNTLHVLTDVYGPRLTGSPNAKAAGEWVAKRATEWGLKNAHLEPWNFGHPGWLNERTSAFLVSPVKDSLVVEAVAWTPGTEGTVSASVVQIEPPGRVSKQQLAAYFDANGAKVKGKIVMLGPPTKVPVTINKPVLRREDADLRAQYNPTSSAPAAGGPPNVTPTAPANADALPANQVTEQLDQFLVSAGAVARLNDAGRDHGQIRAFNNRTFDVSKAVTTLVVRNEDYGRISRLLADGSDVRLELTVVNSSHPEGRTSYNVVAEIPGSDKAQEVVMVGGHLDSWHAATGATDNAIGCSVMLEAIRILHAIGVQPRRTIRVALWTGEEQGLLGSRAYVKEHFGSFENPKPEYANFAGYFNIDSGTGRARGMTVFGPSEAAVPLRAALAPFADSGVIGATTTRSRRRGGSDHTSFNEAGLPGIGVQQDPIEYGTYTWHTNLDTFERIIEADAQQSAMAIAAAVYHLAMREEKLPRLTKDQMPPLPTTSAQ